MKNITIIDESYKQWLKDLAARYRNSQIKAAIKVNSELLHFYWSLGQDIVGMKVEERWGEKIIDRISKDLRKELPNVSGLSVSNLRYIKRFYLTYSQCNIIRPQVVGEISGNATKEKHPQVVGEISVDSLFMVPWGHHRLILDKVKGNVDKALFYINKTIENGWSRAVLLNWLDTDLYEREGKAISNFKHTLPDPVSDLAQEITKDPYNFAFAEITKPYNEALLKKALLTKITDFLIELGSGFAYVGREYRLQIGETENFIDLLFYHLQLRCYVVVEVKINKFEPSDIGQLGTYVVACNHLLKREEDKPTIGLLICKSKDNTVAKYALESSNQPIGVSEYELEKFYPEKLEGRIPTIEEIENTLNKED